MKKIFTSLFAMAAVFCASAAVPTYEVDPKSGSTIDDRAEFKVTFTFSEEVKADSAQLVGGARFNSQMVTVATTKTAANIIEVTVPSDAWGTANAGEYLLEVVLPEVYDSNGVLIQESDTDEETHETFYYPYTPRTNYISPDNTPAAYVGVDPAPGDMSVWDVYYDGWGAVDFSFTNSVELNGTNAGATIIYGLSDGGSDYVIVSVDDIWADWNMWTGYYGLSVPMLPGNTTLTKSNLVSITVILTGVTSNGKTIEINPIVYSDTKSVKKSAKGNTSGIDIVSSSDIVSVYNLQGVLINKNMPFSSVKNLPAGIYIVNGRKISIK